MSSDAPQILLTHHLKSLRLPTFLREHEKLARLCATEGTDHDINLCHKSLLCLFSKTFVTVEI